MSQGQCMDKEAFGQRIKDLIHTATQNPSSVFAEGAVNALGKILRKNAQDVALDDLRRIAKIRGVTRITGMQDHGAGTPHQITEEEDVDCSQLIELAIEELARRNCSLDNSSVPDSKSWLRPENESG